MLRWMTTTLMVGFSNETQCGSTVTTLQAEWFFKKEDLNFPSQLETFGGIQWMDLDHAEAQMMQRPAFTSQQRFLMHE